MKLGELLKTEPSHGSPLDARVVAGLRSHTNDRTNHPANETRRVVDALEQGADDGIDEYHRATAEQAALQLLAHRWLAVFFRRTRCAVRAH